MPAGGQPARCDAAFGHTHLTERCPDPAQQQTRLRVGLRFVPAQLTYGIDECHKPHIEGRFHRPRPILTSRYSAARISGKLMM